MIDCRPRDIFNAKTEAIVNPVNCVGVMGAGLARQFSRRFPETLQPYKKACSDGVLYPGTVHVHDRGDLNGRRKHQRYILHFPTKKHWRDPSELEWIRTGLLAMLEAMSEYGITSITIPALGVGLGGLNWQDVYDLMRTQFKRIHGSRFNICKPQDHR